MIIDRKGDDLLSRNPLPQHEDLRTALRYAVAVPLVCENGEWSLLFEVRPSNLHSHPSEISFPGGRLEEEDIDPLAGALREMKEELGIDIKDWQVLGALPLAYTYRGRLVAPYLVLHPEKPQMVMNSTEVTDVFTVPLNWLRAENPQVVDMWDGVFPGEGFPYDRIMHYSPGWRRRAKYEIYIYNYGQYTIWGLTARIIRSFLAILEKEQIPNDFDFSNWR